MRETSARIAVYGPYLKPPLCSGLRVLEKRLSGQTDYPLSGCLSVLFAHTVSSDRTLETIHSIMFWAYQYQLNVTNYGNPSGLTRSYWTLDYSLVVHGVITALVQAYYSYRLYTLSGWVVISVVAWTGSLLEVVGSTYCAYALATAKHPYQDNIYRAAIVTAALDVSIDIINTSSLCYCLYKKRTAARRYMHFRWTIESGMVTAIMAVSIMVTSIVIPRTAIFSSITAFYPKGLTHGVHLARAS
ncbi:uncharacterized protein STEHIDRAFT_114419 [Stereum hirsutum FP-91666 SS1]|uniref:uncharacterized protein n=1 Tax=Stereum hirsutum (strain FP-91666) TaxID=721885 RepID=UPI0004449F9C|nr:uncharacterized protein STEHIDRAFT_114419 [Stereum hirsutum FP-91666 SS1]EIM82525.1 hypothetical protein STEHIDRAFT_114419 [Stereum hirsutum FP-91666 SS1]